MKNLMITTALIVSGASIAYADAHGSSPFRTEAAAMEVLASNFIGMRVYTAENELASDSYDGADTEWNDVGEINDVILNRDGMVEAVLVDIGGFLGIGERQVAMNMKSVKFVSDSSTEDDATDFFLVVSADRAMIQDAPEYSWDTAAMDETKTTFANIKRDGYEAAMAEYITTETLTGAPVYDANDEWIGEISELLVGDDTQIEKAVVDVGGFLGLGEKPVALDLTSLAVLRKNDGDDLRVHVDMTKEQLEAMQTYEK
ncbi:MAG: PRC-barrel domain-containing protein [Pseudomonadota bacterium]